MMNNPDQVEFSADLMMFDNGTEREPEFRILDVTGKNIPVQLLVYLDSMNGQENEHEAFDFLPIGLSRVKISAFYDYGDRDVGIFDGWSIENVEVEKEV